MADLEPIGRAAHGRPARAGQSLPRAHEAAGRRQGIRADHGVLGIRAAEPAPRPRGRGPQPIDGTWNLEPDRDGTRVTFLAEGELRGPLRVLRPLVKRLIARQFAGYHRKLRRNLEAG